VVSLFIQQLCGIDVEGEDKYVGVFHLMRLTRIFRLIRIFRIFRFLRELLLLAQGIIGAMKALVWAMLIVFLTLYTCSIFVTKFIGKEASTELEKESSATSFEVASAASPSLAEEVEDWFGTVWKSLFTLIQLMTLEDWGSVVRVTMNFMPSGYLWGLFFVVFVMFTNLVLLNLVTGVILENVLTISRKEEEKALQKEESHRVQTVLKIHHLFDTVLGDRQTDELSIEEFKQACQNPRVVKQLANLQIAVYEAEELFILMDTAKRGNINIDHFIEGCLRIRGAARAKHLLAVQYDVQKVWSKLSLQMDEAEDRLIMGMQRACEVTTQEILENLQDSMNDWIQPAVREAVEAIMPALSQNCPSHRNSKRSDGCSDLSSSKSKKVQPPDVPRNGVLPPQATNAPALLSLACIPGQAWTSENEAASQATKEEALQQYGSEDSRWDKSISPKPPSKRSSESSEPKQNRASMEVVVTAAKQPSAIRCNTWESETSQAHSSSKHKRQKSVSGQSVRGHDNTKQCSRHIHEGPLSQRVQEATTRLLDLRREDEGLLKRFKQRQKELSLISRLLHLQESRTSQSNCDVTRSPSINRPVSRSRRRNESVEMDLWTSGGIDAENMIRNSRSSGTSRSSRLDQSRRQFGSANTVQTENPERLSKVVPAPRDWDD